MKIALVNITSGGISGGYRKYLQAIVPRLAKHERVESLLCAAPGRFDAGRWFKGLTNVKCVECGPYRFSKYEDHVLEKELSDYSPDVIFVPVERYFRFRNVPVVTMIQNMEALAGNVKGNAFFEKIRQRVQYREGRKAVLKADRTIAISSFVKDFLVSNWNIPVDKIGLVYYGIENNGFGGKCRKPAIVPGEWKGRYIFTAGSVRPARGIDDALRALQIILSGPGNIDGMVIAGEAVAQMMKYKRQLEKWIGRNGLTNKICWAGRLSEEEMHWCYRHCNIFLMTSRVESFGMIGLEALSHGCICIAADNPCLPEIFAKNAFYYNPRDAGSLAECIRKALRLTNEERAAMSAGAKRRASDFSWDIAAEQTLIELEKAIPGTGL